MSEKKKAIIAEIEAARRSLIDLVQNLDAESLALPTCCEGWSVKDILAHLSAGEAGLLQRARNAANGESTVPAPGFNLNQHNQERIEQRRDWSVTQLVAEMNQNRAETLKFMETVPEEHLDRMGQLGPRQLTAGQIIAHIAHHEIEHAEHIRTAFSR